MGIATTTICEQVKTLCINFYDDYKDENYNFLVKSIDWLVENNFWNDALIVLSNLISYEKSRDLIFKLLRTFNKQAQVAKELVSFEKFLERLYNDEDVVHYINSNRNEFSSVFLDSFATKQKMNLMQNSSKSGIIGRMGDKK